MYQDVVAPSCFVVDAWGGSQRTICPMLVLGHRGSPVEVTENTLGSFEAALRAGADGVELDVRQCATGELVVCHDATLARLSSADVRVQATGWDTLRRAALVGDTRIPLLADVLQLCARRGRVNVEVKSDDGCLPALVRALVAVLSDHPSTEVVVSSFDPGVLAGLRALRPQVRRGLLLPPTVRYPRESRSVIARTAEAAPHAMHPWYGDATPERVRWWRALGLDVSVWTVDDTASATELATCGASSVITNVPTVIVPAINPCRRESL